MHPYIEKVVATIHRDSRPRAIHVPRRVLPRRARATFVPVERSVALALAH